MKKSAAILTLVFSLSILNGFGQSLQNDVALVSLEPGFEFPHEEKITVYSSSLIGEWIKDKKSAKAVLGYTGEGRTVEAYYFPGSSNKKALVIAGMHGSELSSIEMAKQLIEVLSEGERPYYNVVIVPSLFPDNASKAMRVTKQKDNIGRYTTEESVDPNRQMPQPGKAFSPELPFDIYGRTIEKENQFLLQLIQDYSPSRIVNLHAIKDVTKAGIYADPRTDCDGYALGLATDSSLAVSMASLIESGGGKVPGNNLQQTPTALYYNDPEVAPVGLFQKRNFLGSAMPNSRGYGASLGGWASTAVCDETGQRDAARLITVEFPGYQPSSAYKDKTACMLNIQLYVAAVRKIFLEEYFAE
ncbi:MAG TPA: hypothetical protein VL095_06925 [Flavisolibacter sp.]|nr:hypothetical protein [Flavisolibacter sp.]